MNKNKVLIYPPPPLKNDTLYFLKKYNIYINNDNIEQNIVIEPGDSIKVGFINPKTKKLKLFYPQEKEHFLYDSEDFNRILEDTYDIDWTEIAGICRVLSEKYPDPIPINNKQWTFRKRNTTKDNSEVMKHLQMFPRRSYTNTNTQRLRKKTRKKRKRKK